MSAKDQEAENLWQQMLAVEREPARSPEDFQRKKREMSKLKAAYDKAVGVDSDPMNARQQKEVSERMFFQKTSKPEDLHPTRDRLNDNLPRGIDLRNT